MATAQKKITRATIKSFVRKNRENLHILTKSRFDGMVDGCRETGDHEFTPALHPDNGGNPYHDLGIAGAWLVGQSRDWFEAYDDGAFQGFRVSNCCGRFVLAIPAE